MCVVTVETVTRVGTRIAWTQKQNTFKVSGRKYYFIYFHSTAMNTAISTREKKITILHNLNKKGILWICLFSKQNMLCKPDTCCCCIHTVSFCISYLCNQVWIRGVEVLHWSRSDYLWGNQPDHRPVHAGPCFRWGTACRCRRLRAEAERPPAGLLSPHRLMGTSSGGVGDADASFQRYCWRNWRQSHQDLRRTSRNRMCFKICSPCVEM